MISNARWLFAHVGGELIRSTMLAPLVFVVALVVALGGCSDYPLSPHEQQLLAEAHAKWAATGLSDYTVEARIVCFCPPHLAQWTKLTVRGDVVVEARPIESLPDGITPDLMGWLTINDEFDRLSNPADILEKIDVLFDSQLGFPKYINANCGPNVADCGSVHEMRNVQPLATPAIRS